MNGSGESSGSDGSDDDRVFIRSRWGTSRYVYNPNNPVGVALIIGSLLFAGGGMFLLYHPQILDGSRTWDGDELRSAVRAASSEIGSEARFGPGTVNFEDIIRSRIAKKADKGENGEDALSVTLTSDPPEPAMYDGGTEQADYSVTAEGTDTALCLHAEADKRAKTMDYASVVLDVRDGACSDSDSDSDSGSGS